MKNLKFILPVLLLSFFGTDLSAQKSTVTFIVLGNCGMCKKTIEAAAIKAGAKTAVWNKDTHELTVVFKENKTSVDAIQKGIAESGYDTPKFKAADAAYKNLHACCQYDRSESFEQ